MGKNVRTVRRRVTNKRYSVRNKEMTKQKEKGTGQCHGEIYHDQIFFRDDALACKNETINKKIEQIFVADSGSTSHMVNSLENMTNLREVKTVVNTGKKKTMMGSLQSDWKEYHKRDGKFYQVRCTETAYILGLSVNIFSVTGASTKVFNVTSDK